MIKTLCLMWQLSFKTKNVGAVAATVFEFLPHVAVYSILYLL